MSSPQTNFENNNRMSELTKNINDIFGYILLYSVIIFTTISALFGGIVVYPIYGVIYIFNKIKARCCANVVEENEMANVVEENEITTVKKPIIDETWCNVSVKNIINFENEIEEVLSIRKPSEEELQKFQEEYDKSVNEIVADDKSVNEIVADDNSPNDKYSIGHYKSKKNFIDPLDFDN